jgi:hypothetical protein
VISSGILFTCDRIPSLLVVYLGLPLPGLLPTLAIVCIPCCKLASDYCNKEISVGGRSEEGVRREWSRSQKYKKGNMISAISTAIK